VAERGERIGGTYRTKCPKTPTAVSGYTASGGVLPPDFEMPTLARVDLLLPAQLARLWESRTM